MLGGGFDESVSGYPLYVSLMTDSVRHANEDWLKTLRFHFIQRSTSNPRQCLKSLETPKETFYVFRRTKSTNS